MPCTYVEKAALGIETPCGETFIPVEDLGSETIQQVFIRLQCCGDQKKKADDTKLVLGL